MKAHGLVWAGTRTPQYREMSRFLTDVVEVPVVFEVDGYVVHQMPDGAQVEVFTPQDPDHKHFTSGPVPGLLVDDVHEAVVELRAAGIELLGPTHVEHGHAWQHFRAPDGNVWEVTHRPAPSGRIVFEHDGAVVRHVVEDTGDRLVLERDGGRLGHVDLLAPPQPGREHAREVVVDGDEDTATVLLPTAVRLARELGLEVLNATLPAGGEGVHLRLGWVEVARSTATFRISGQPVDGVHLARAVHG